MKSILSLTVFAILLSLTTSKSHAFNLTCEAVGRGDNLEGVAVINITDDFPGLILCHTKRGKSVFLTERSQVVLGALISGFGGEALTLSCPFVSLKQLQKRNDRTLHILDAEAGALILGAGAGFGFDNRLNFCFLSHMRFGVLGARAGFRSFDLEIAD